MYHFSHFVFPGVVTITVPTTPVNYTESVTVTCESQKDLGTQPKWQLKTDSENYVITTGTVATLTTKSNKSNVSLSSVDELWAGALVYMSDAII